MAKKARKPAESAPKRPIGRPKGSGKGLDAVIKIRATSTWLAELDAWREAQLAPPSRSDAIRGLAGLGLSAAKAGFNPKAGRKGGAVAAAAHESASR